MKTVAADLIIEEPDNHHRFRLVADGHLLEDTQLSNVAEGWDGSSGRASLWLWDTSIEKVSAEPLTELARFFLGVHVYLPAAEKDANDWDFRMLEIGDLTNQSKAGVLLKIDCDPESWPKPYSMRIWPGH